MRRLVVEKYNIDLSICECLCYVVCFPCFCFGRRAAKKEEAAKAKDREANKGEDRDGH